mgnify:CR=1 FL=1
MLCHRLPGSFSLSQLLSPFRFSDFRILQAYSLEGCEDYNLYINIYQIYVDHNKAVDGDAYLKMALELEPQDGEDCYHRGRIYEYEKNYEAARDELKTV